MGSDGYVLGVRVILSWVVALLAVIAVGIALDSGTKVASPQGLGASVSFDPSGAVLFSGTIAGVFETRSAGSSPVPARNGEVDIFAIASPGVYLQPGGGEVSVEVSCAEPIGSPSTPCNEEPQGIAPVAKATTGNGGRFSVAVAQGLYEVFGADGCSMATVNVPAGVTSRVRIVCQAS
jgi:hypothetical protein